jgi:hypothetical protein
MIDGTIGSNEDWISVAMLGVDIGVIIAVAGVGSHICLLVKKRGVVEGTSSEALNFSGSDNDPDEAL